MKGFLLDENLPGNAPLKTALPVVHARELGESPSDADVWAYALANELAIVSKDADFSDRIMAATPPPWVVHLRFGNLKLAAFNALIAKVWPAVETLLPENKLVCVYADRIESFGE